MPSLTRRQALAASVAIPAAAALGVAPVHAAAPQQGMSQTRINRFMLGDLEVTTLLAGAAIREEPQGIFGMNVPAEDFTRVSQDNFIPSDKTKFFFTPTLVNTGRELVLFDTGLNGAGIAGVLEQAGYSTDQVDTVVITHMHGDHIGGLMTGDNRTFANARYITGATEHNYWAGTDNAGFANLVAPLSEEFTFLDDGGTVASGITAMAAPGHTPGHMGYRLESNGQSVVLIVDLANHYVWSLAYPDWEVKFDMDKAAAAASRRRVLGMLAADKTPFIGYHMPFPALGYVETRGDGFRYVPASYQMSLG